MDHDRRLELARLAEAHLPDLHQAVVESWCDLMPAAATWQVNQRRRAHAAARAVLAGLAVVIAQGDLEETEWRRTRETLYGRGHATPDEVDELLRSVRIVGVEGLLEILTEEAGLLPDERWTLQLQAHTFSEQLHRNRDEVDPANVQALLAHLESEGADLS
jgi:hypothetical protein